MSTPQDQDPKTTTTLIAHCLCRTNTFTAALPTSHLPLPASACHCTSCRHVTGALYSLDVEWPDLNPDVSGLKTYAFSERISVHFCGTCGTPVFFGHPQSAHLGTPWGVFAGTLVNGKEEAVKTVRHIFVGDTRDGGAAVAWLKKSPGDGKEIPRFRGHAEGEGRLIEVLPGDWPPVSALSGYKDRVQDSVPVRCKCRGVDLVLHRADVESWVKKGEEVPWYVDRESGKYAAGLCVCDSCRLFAGVDAFPWTFAALSSLSSSKGGGKALPEDVYALAKMVDERDPAVGTLRYYKSSGEVLRFFCGDCSASVFFACDSRPGVVDVGVGLLEAEDGARAEGFLVWRYERVSHPEDAKGGWREGLVQEINKEGGEFKERYFGKGKE